MFSSLGVVIEISELPNDTRLILSLFTFFVHLIWPWNLLDHSTVSGNGMALAELFMSLCEFRQGLWLLGFLKHTLNVLLSSLCLFCMFWEGLLCGLRNYVNLSSLVYVRNFCFYFGHSFWPWLCSMKVKETIFKIVLRWQWRCHDFE